METHLSNPYRSGVKRVRKSSRMSAARNRKKDSERIEGRVGKIR